MNLPISTKHPQLFATDAEWERSRLWTEEHPAGRALLAELERRASLALQSGPVQFVRNGRRLLECCRKSQERVLVFATVFRLTGKRDFLEAARAELAWASAVEDWNSSHFLDVAEMAFGVAVGLNWLREELSPEERTNAEAALISRALRPSFEGNPEELWWIKATNNWNQVCHGGLLVAALAVEASYPEWAPRVIERALRFLPLVAEAYAPDGVYPEGPLYWCYGTTFHVLMIDALRSAQGSESGAADFPGFLESAEFLHAITGPTGEVFNFADSRRLRGAGAATGSHGQRLEGFERGFHTTLFWFARRLNRPDLVEAELQGLCNQGAEVAEPADRFLPFVALWAPDLAAAKVPRGSRPLGWLGRGSNSVVTARSGWNDPGAWFFALKGGSPSVSHGHMDVGTFVLEAQGVRWAVDLGLEDYTNVEAAGVNLWDRSQKGARWGLFRLGPESHNIPRCASGFQKVDGSAEFSGFVCDAEGTRAILDLEPVYRGEVRRFRRGASLRASGEFMLRDEWEGSSSEVVRFQWLTHAAVEPELAGFRLNKSGETLSVLLTASKPWQLNIWDVSAPPSSFEEANPGLKRIEIQIPTDEQGSGFLQLVAGSRNGANDLPLSEWIHPKTS